jgi:DNA polymerase-3 subunit beta
VVAEWRVESDGDGFVTVFKATVSRDAFLKCIGRVYRVIARRNTIPILDTVLIRSEAGRLVLQATDLDIQIVSSVEAKVEAGAGVTVPAHTLHDIVRKLPDGADITIEAKSDASITVKAGRSRFTLQTLPESDFPELVAGELAHLFDIAAADLKRMIDRTQFAISTEETRYYLNGIYLHVEEGKLRGVATDGHRLALIDLAVPAGADKIPGVIVPRKTVGEVQRLLDGAETVTVELSEGKIRFTVGEVILTSKLIDGTFPDYRRVIPQNNDKVLEVARAELAEAVDRVSTVASEKGRAVKLTLSSGKLDLSVTSPDNGSAAEELEVGYAAEPMEIGFNARYLLDILAQVEGDAAVVRLDSPGSPTIIEAKEGSGAVFVLMPMRVA